MASDRSFTQLQEYSANFISRAERDPQIRRVFQLHTTDLYVDFWEQRYVAKQGIFIGNFEKLFVN